MDETSESADDVKRRERFEFCEPQKCFVKKCGEHNRRIGVPQKRAFGRISGTADPIIECQADRRPIFVHFNVVFPDGIYLRGEDLKRPRFEELGAFRQAEQKGRAEGRVDQGIQKGEVDLGILENGVRREDLADALNHWIFGRE
jgi:hypothetical protein